MTTWLAMLLVGMGSFAFRAVPLLVLPRFTVPPRVEAALRDGGTAAVTALIVSAVLHRGTTGNLGATVLAVGVALALAVRGTSMLRLVGAGLGVYAMVRVATVLFL